MLTWLRKHTKTIMIAVVVLFAASMFYGLGYQGLKGDGRSEKGSSSLAKVNGQAIDPLRYREFLNRIAPKLGRNLSSADLAFLDNLAFTQTVEFYILLGEAKQRARVSGKEIDAAVENIMQQQKIPSRRELENSLKQMGLSLIKFRDLIKDDILVQKLQMKMAEELRVTPDDLKEVKASHILVSTEADARKVLQLVKKGEDFSSLAKKYSLDPGSANKGGDLGYFSTGMMIEPFEKAAFSLKAGEVSGSIKTAYGYHILKVLDSRLRKFPGKEPIEQQARREKQEKTFRRWFSEARNQAKIEILNPILRGHDLRFKGRPLEAIAEYKKALIENPNNPTVHIYLGDAYLSGGRKDLALAEYENAVKMEGGNPELYLILGKAYENVGEKSLATDQFKKASLIAGDNKAIHEKLLEVFKNLQRPMEAAHEKAELKRIEKKEKFEKELGGGK